MNSHNIDWNKVWQEAQRTDSHPRTKDERFWDKRAPEFTRHCARNDYIDQFIALMKPEPAWSILDIGCAAGTLAVPLAPHTASITALDPSPVMLDLLGRRCRESDIHNIRTVRGRWEDDWEQLRIGVHDIAVASRSLIVEDLRGAITKLAAHARRRVFLSTLVDEGPHDRRIIEAVGRTFHQGADYIVVCNLLRSMGIFANVNFTVQKKEKIYAGLEDAVNDMRWMIHDITSEEEERLRDHLSRTLVSTDGGWRLPYQKVVRWAVMWWDKEQA